MIYSIFWIAYTILLIYNHATHLLRGNNNKYIFLLYLVPLIGLPKLFKNIKNIMRHDTYLFDKRMNSFIHNGMRVGRLSNIEKVMIDYPNKHNIETCHLDIISASIPRFTIDEHSANFNQELIDAARQIAIFLSVPVEDAHPYEEVL